MNPLNGIITSSFGERRNPITGEWELHTGVDIAVAENTPVAAVSTGIVTETGTTAINGRYLKLETDAGYTVVFAHLNQQRAKKDQRVEQGEIVALSGNTGRSSGPHLHYGVYKDGVLQDPMAFIRLAYTEEVTAEYLARGDVIH